MGELRTFCSPGTRPERFLEEDRFDRQPSLRFDRSRNQVMRGSPSIFRKLIAGGELEALFACELSTTFSIEDDT
jgi:hypothetical protein